MDKEWTYEKQIAPLVEQIKNICMMQKIPFFMLFEESENRLDLSASQHELGHVIFDFLVILSKCTENYGINFDKFLIEIVKKARIEGSNLSSFYLHLLGAKVSTNGNIKRITIKTERLHSMSYTPT